MVLPISVGEVVWADKDCFPIDTTYYVKLTSHKKTDLRYLILKSLNLQNLKGGAGIPGLNRQDVYAKYKIPLPSIKVQKEIVAEIEKEQNMVEECKKLITIHKQKIKDKIVEVWGEE